MPSGINFALLKIILEYNICILFIHNWGLDSPKISPINQRSYAHVSCDLEDRHGQMTQPKTLGGSLLKLLKCGKNFECVQKWSFIFKHF